MAALTFVTMPMALAGGALATLLSGGVLTLGALFWLLGCLCPCCTQYLWVDQTLPASRTGNWLAVGPPDLVSRGVSERFGQIVTTALTVALALAPFIFLGNIAGHEIVRPMAMVIIGGLVTTLLYNLLVVPALYLRYGQVTETEFIDAFNKQTQPDLRRLISPALAKF